VRAIRLGPDANSLRLGKDGHMDWSHMSHWGWAMMTIWTALWLIIVALIVVVGLRWTRLQ
jgi:hypothetical protein